MTELQKRRTDEPVMGRADVLFRFLQLINKDRPADVDRYLDRVNVRDENRPIVDQLVDAIIAGDRSLYEKFEQAQREVGKRNPYSTFEDQIPPPTYETALGLFLSRWIELESLLAKKSKNEEPSSNKLNIFSNQLRFVPQKDRKIVEYFRMIRNDVVHGKKSADEQLLREGSRSLEQLLQKWGEETHRKGVTTNYHVSKPYGAKQWVITREGTKRPEAMARTQAEAEKMAHELILKAGGGELIVHTGSGPSVLGDMRTTDTGDKEGPFGPRR